MKLSAYWLLALHAHLSFSVCLTIWLSSSPLCSLYSSLCQILSPTLWILTPHLVMMCLSDLTVWSSLLLRSSSYQDCSTHSSQPLGLLISVFQAHLSPSIIFLTDSYDPTLKCHLFSFPVLVVYWSVFWQRTLLSHGCCHSSQSISICHGQLSPTWSESWIPSNGKLFSSTNIGLDTQSSCLPSTCSGYFREVRSVCSTTNPCTKVINVWPSWAWLPTSRADGDQQRSVGDQHPGCFWPTLYAYTYTYTRV